MVVRRAHPSAILNRLIASNGGSGNVRQGLWLSSGHLLLSGDGLGLGT